MLTLISLLFFHPSQTLAPWQAALLKAAAAAPRQETADPAFAIMDLSQREFIGKLRRYASESAKMPPAQAASRFLTLIQEGDNLPMHPLVNGSPDADAGSLSTVFQVLPRPASWPFIEDQLRKQPPTRTNLGELLIFARLRGDDRQVLQLCGKLAKPLAKSDVIGGYQDNAIAESRYEALIRLRDFAAAGDTLAGRVEFVGGAFVDVPPVAEQMDGKNAESTLLRLLKNRTRRLVIEDSQTRVLAQKVALANLGSIKRAPWYLIFDLADTSFLRKLIAHHGAGSLMHSEATGRALSVWDLDSLTNRRNEDSKTVLSPSMNLWQNLALSESTPLTWDQWHGVYDVICKAISSNPEQIPWLAYAQSATATNRTAEAATRIGRALTKPDLSPETKETLRNSIAKLNAASADPGAPGNLSFSLLAKNQQFEIRLILQDSSLLSEAMPFVLNKAVIEHNNDALELLLSHHRFSELESVCLDELKRRLSNGVDASQAADLLCRTYQAANRPNDILFLFSRVRMWNQGDLSELDPDFASSLSGRRDFPISYYAAWALSRSGKKKLAIRVLRSILRKTTSCDPAYDLLNSLTDPATAEFYDELATANPNENRPLIWKADLLRRQGKIRDALKCVKAAIAMNPSDLSVPVRYRFIAYEVMARIYEGLRDHQRAKDCRRVLKAAKLCVEGDRAAGLDFLYVAENLYRLSVSLLAADAYSQMKLAECLSDEGKHREAQSHYLASIRCFPAMFGFGTARTVWVNKVFRNRTLLASGLSTFRSIPHGSALEAQSLFVKSQFEREAGLNAQAIKDLRRSVSLEPQFHLAWESLDGLGTGRLSQSEAATVVRRTSWMSSLYRPWDLLSCISDLRLLYGKFATRSKVPETPLFALKQIPNADVSSMYERSNPDDLKGLSGSYFEGDGTVARVLIEASAERQDREFRRHHSGFGGLNEASPARWRKSLAMSKVIPTVSF